MQIYAEQSVISVVSFPTLLHLQFQSTKIFEVFGETTDIPAVLCNLFIFLSELNTHLDYLAIF